MERIPPEILIKIFQCLDVKDLREISMVCSRWKEAVFCIGLKKQKLNLEVELAQISSLSRFISKFVSNLTVLSIYAENRRKKSDLLQLISRESALSSALFSLNNLYCLTLHCFIVDVYLPPTIKHINVNFGKISEKSLSMALTHIFECCPSIERVNFSYIYDKSALQAARGLLFSPQLRCFYISSKYYSRKFLKVLTTVSPLVEIGLELYTGSICELFFRALSMTRNIKVLVLNGVQNLDTFVEEMFGFNYEIPSLIDITVVNCSQQLDSRFFNVLSSNVPNLTKLRIKNTPVNSKQLLRYVEASEKIKELYLSIEVFSINKFISKLLIISSKRKFDNICLCDFPNLYDDRYKFHLQETTENHFPCTGCQLYSLANSTCQCY